MRLRIRRGGAPRARRVRISRPRAAPREEEAGHVERGEEEKQQRSRHQHLEGLVELAAEGRMSVAGRGHHEGRGEELRALLRAHAREALAAGVLVEHRLEPGLEPGLRPRRGEAGPKPSQDLHPARAAVEQLVPSGRGLPFHGRRYP
jgi:hypothetical protein